MKEKSLALVSSPTAAIRSLRSTKKISLSYQNVVWYQQVKQHPWSGVHATKLELGRLDILITTLPLFHSSGLISTFLFLYVLHWTFKTSLEVHIAHIIAKKSYNYTENMHKFMSKSAIQQSRGLEYSTSRL